MKKDQLSYSYSCEFTDIVTVLLTLDIIVRFYKITAGSITTNLDGLSALNKSGGDWPLSTVD